MLKSVFQNPSAVNVSTINRWKNTTKVTFLGHVENMEEYFHKASMYVCLHIAKECTKALLDQFIAAASCAIVTTDTIGCEKQLFQIKLDYWSKLEIVII